MFEYRHLGEPRLAKGLHEAAENDNLALRNGQVCRRANGTPGERSAAYLDTAHGNGWSPHDVCPLGDPLSLTTLLAGIDSEKRVVLSRSCQFKDADLRPGSLASLGGGGIAFLGQVNEQ